MKLFVSFLVIFLVLIANAPNTYAGTFPGSNGKILFDTSRDSHYQIYLMDADGSNQTNISNTPDSDYLGDWSPDGSKIVFVSERDIGGGGEIYVMDSDGNNQMRLTNNASYDAYPSWFPMEIKLHFNPIEILQLRFS